jgi:ubiquitin carboxyl-terminal hydrolase 10
LTHTETLTGDFGGRGNVAAKKQVFIDTLPPVLILHLKRFQYENALGGTQKIWKKVGYPLELEIPKEVLPPSKRGGLAVKGGLPKYRLISVVYHHGKSAAGGHYTVDVLRQDSSEWVRMDDTIIRRVRPQDVAEGGAEEDPKLLAKALEQHKNDSDLQKQRNMYEGLDDDDRRGPKSTEVLPLLPRSWQLLLSRATAPPHRPAMSGHQPRAARQSKTTRSRTSCCTSASDLERTAWSRPRRT